MTPPTDPSAESVEPTAPDATPPTDAVDESETLIAPDTGPEMETFYTFTWGGRGNQQGQRPQGRRNDGPKGKGKPKGKGGPRGDKPQKFSSKPKKEKAIDPDNPFAAALAGLKKD